jgi:hypothetical protein
MAAAVTAGMGVWSSVAAIIGAFVGVTLGALWAYRAGGHS